MSLNCPSYHIRNCGKSGILYDKQNSLSSTPKWAKELEMAIVRPFDDRKGRYAFFTGVNTISDCVHERHWIVFMVLNPDLVFRTFAERREMIEGTREELENLIYDLSLEEQREEYKVRYNLDRGENAWYEAVDRLCTAKSEYRRLFKKEPPTFRGK